MTPQEMAAELGKPKHVGKEWMGLCPAHNDTYPSLSITQKNGKLVFVCRAGCEQDAVMSALVERGLWNEPKASQQQKRSIVSTYNYCDQDGKLRYQVVRTDPKGFWQRQPNGSESTFINNMDGIEPLPYRLPELLKDSAATVYIPEGEKDCDNLARLGLVATCNHGGAEKWNRKVSHWLTGRRIVILPDNDDSGHRHARDVAAKLAGIASSIRIVDLRMPIKGGDVSNWIDAGGTAEALEALAAAEQEARPVRQSTSILKRGKETVMKSVDWLWKGWLARGKFHLLAGSKSVGKSTIVYDLMAAMTIGGKWPDGTLAPIGDVLVWSGEDDVADTILPRFVAAGGDPCRFYYVDKIPTEAGGERPFDPSTDLEMLVEAASTLPELRFVLIDPVVMVIPSRTDSHRNAETRRGLQPLVDFAEARNVVLLGITHFSKGTGDADPVERINGSLAFGALARIVLGASADEDGNLRRLVRIASNIGPSGGGFEYTLFQTPLVDHDFSAQRVTWGARLTGSPKELLSGKKRSAIADAAAFLVEFLRDGKRSANDVQAAADANGHSWATVRRAKEALGIKPKEDGSGWFWALPQVADVGVSNWSRD